MAGVLEEAWFGSLFTVPRSLVADFAGELAAAVLLVAAVAGSAPGASAEIWSLDGGATSLVAFDFAPAVLVSPLFVAGGADAVAATFVFCGEKVPESSRRSSSGEIFGAVRCAGELRGVMVAPSVGALVVGAEETAESRAAILIPEIPGAEPVLVTDGRLCTVLF